MILLIYLLLTIAIEGAVLALLSRGWHQQQQLVLLLANACSWSTLQILWRNYAANIWILECSVFIFEAIALFYVAQLPLRKSFIVAFITNAVSLGVGLLIHGIPK